MLSVSVFFTKESVNKSSGISYGGVGLISVDDCRLMVIRAGCYVSFILN
jgi:hypothetical protein